MAIIVACILCCAAVVAAGFSWKTVWEKPFAADSLGGDRLFCQTDKERRTIYCVSNGNFIESLDMHTGSSKWLSVLKGDSLESPNEPLLYKSKLFVGCLRGHYLCINTQTGAIERGLSQKTMEKGLLNPKEVFSGAVVNDTLVIGGRGKRYTSIIRGLHCDSLKPLWKVDLTACQIRGKPASDGKKVYFIADSNVLSVSFAGKVIWTCSGQYAGFTENHPVVDSGRLFYSGRRLIRCLSCDNGQELWKSENLGDICGVPLVSSNRVYVSNGENRVLCLDALKGSVLWETKFSEGISNRYAPVLLDSLLLMIHAVSDPGKGFPVFHLYCIHSHSGKIVGDEILPIGESFSNPILIDGRRIFVQSKKDKPGEQNSQIAVLRAMDLIIK